MRRGRAPLFLSVALAMLAAGSDARAAEAPLEQASGELGQLRTRIETLRSEQHDSTDYHTYNKPEQDAP